MLSRRSFMRLSSAAAATAVASKSTMGASAQGERPQEAARGPLPPAIAALPSMTARVRPITNDERMARVEKAKSLMAANKIDAIALCGGTSTLYFANAQIGGGERLWAVVIPAKANPFIVCPAFEEGRTRDILANSPFGSSARLERRKTKSCCRRARISACKTRRVRKQSRRHQRRVNIAARGYRRIFVNAIVSTCTKFLLGTTPSGLSGKESPPTYTEAQKKEKVNRNFWLLAKYPAGKSRGGLAGHQYIEVAFHGRPHEQVLLHRRTPF